MRKTANIRKIKPKNETDRKLTVFNTSCGFFAFISANGALLHTFLPAKNKQKQLRNIFGSYPEVIVDNLCLEGVQNLITDYYNGICVDFTAVEINLENYTKFSRKILTSLRSVKYGQTITYGQLAEKAGYPNAARAAGTVLAKNPLPLIIPCHRVICANGDIGNFTAEGGTATKKHMLELENTI